jgi:putative flavoprotein involved in K+ transport
VAIAQHGFTLETTDGIHFADQVVIAAGGYQIPMIPRCAERLPIRHRADSFIALYAIRRSCPPGAVLVVGSGQSGCQIAEDLHIAGRKVHLCIGDAPRVARRYRGKDVVEWLHLMGYYDLPVHEHPLREGVRDKTNHYVTGRDGGRDIDLRQRALEGMELYGRLLDVSGDRLMLDDDLAQCLDQADQVSESIKTSIDGFIAKKKHRGARGGALQAGLGAVPRTRGLDYRAAGITSIVWCIGFRTDYSWLDLPVFNGRGQPSHVRGVTPVPGCLFSRAAVALYLGLRPVLRRGARCRISAEHIKTRIGLAGPDGRPAVVNEAAIGT